MTLPDETVFQLTMSEDDISNDLSTEPGLGSFTAKILWEKHTPPPIPLASRKEHDGVCQ